MVLTQTTNWIAYKPAHLLEREAPIAPPNPAAYWPQRFFSIAYQKNIIPPRRAHMVELEGYRAKGGWKIHVSASITSARTVAALVLPVLHRARVWHKFVPLLKNLGAMKGEQYGKFITIYPNPDNIAAADGWQILIPAITVAIQGSGIAFPRISDPREVFVTPLGQLLPPGISMRQVDDFTQG